MAKKKAPQRLAGAEESCISPEQEAIIQWFRTVKFRKNLLGGVDEAAMWKKLEELYALYEAAIRAERTRYNVLLEQQTGSLPLDTAKVDSFAKGSPTRATTTTAASGGNREELLGQRPAERECNTLHEADAGSRNPDAVTAKPVTERFSLPLEAEPTAMSRPRPLGEVAKPIGFDGEGEPATQKEAHSDAPAGQ